MGVLLASCALLLSAHGQYRNGVRSSSPPISKQAPPPESRVDINSAGFDELMKIPGMKRTWANRIVRFRPYRTKQDLLDQGIVPEYVYSRIKDYVIAHRATQ